MRLEHYQIMTATNDELQQWRKVLLDKYNLKSASDDMGMTRFTKTDRTILNAIYTELWRRGVYGSHK